MQGYSLKLPTSSPRAVRKGDLVHCAAEKKTAVLPYSTACSVLCPYFTRMHRLDLWGLYQQPDENYIHTRAIPAYTVYIMQQMSIGPWCLSLIAFLKQDQTGSAGGVLAVM